MYTHLQRTVLLCNMVAFFCKVTCTIDPTKPLLKHRKLMTSTGFISLQFPLAQLQSSFNFHPLPHTYFPHTFMGAIDFFQALTFFTAVFPILLPNQSCHLCALLSPHAAKNSWENWITMLIDSATILQFPMSAEPRAARQKGYSFLLGRSCLSTHQLLPVHQPSCPPTFSLPSLFTLESTFYWELSGHQLWTLPCPSSVSLYLSDSLLICTSLFTMGESWTLYPRELAGILFYLCQDWASLYIPSLCYH